MDVEANKRRIRTAGKSYRSRSSNPQKWVVGKPL